MGTAGSKASPLPTYCNGVGPDDGDEGEGTAQLYVSLRLEGADANAELVPHVFGSVTIIGSWDPVLSMAMERESASTWELSFVAPANHESLDFKFLLKPKETDVDAGDVPCVVEEGPVRLLQGGKLGKDARPALFCVGDDVVEYSVFISTDVICPFDLAASWRAYQGNLKPSTIRGIPDICITNVAHLGTDSSKNGSANSLELEIERYEIPTPTDSPSPRAVYSADLAENHRSMTDDVSNPHQSDNVSVISVDRTTTSKDLEGVISHFCESFSSLGPGMVQSRSVGTFSSLQKHAVQKGLYIDRGVGSSRLARSPSTSTLSSVFNLEYDSKKAMPAAAGAVAAAAVADRMLGHKEDRQLAIVLVGLPARGKTFTATKLTRYLRWLGHETKHFNVGKYRRLKHGAHLSADFFRGDNPEGLEARNEVAALAMEDMLSWMQEGGQVGIFDATNSTKKRRNMLMKMAEGRCKIIFLETICNDESIIERNILLKIQQSPDYAEETNVDTGILDFEARLANYEKVYEPVAEGSYIKMIDMVSGHGGQLQVNDISGYLPGRIVFFLVNTHLTPRPILLTRHGESRDNVRRRIGGDPVLSENGELYGKMLANFIDTRLKNERTASIWTSTLQRTVLTASSINGFPKIQWRALDEINAGVCDGMTYEEIKKNMPEEYESRKKDKLRYRYPRGESYLDVIQRLEPVIIELERQRAPVVVIAHQAVLRALYGYFADKPLKDIPFIEVPLHTT